MMPRGSWSTEITYLFNKISLCPGGISLKSFDMIKGEDQIDQMDSWARAWSGVIASFPTKIWNLSLFLFSLFWWFFCLFWKREEESPAFAISRYGTCRCLHGAVGKALVLQSERRRFDPRLRRNIFTFSDCVQACRKFWKKNSKKWFFFFRRLPI